MHPSRPTAALALAAAILALTAAPSAADTVRSGFAEIETGSIGGPGENPTGPPTLAEYLVNPGFETGSLPPWTTNNWVVTNNTPHSGTYAAYDVGNFWVRQDFAGVNTTGVTSFTFWAKQPEAGTQLQAYDFFYSDNTFDEFYWFPPDNYGLVNGTSQLRPNATLVAIRIWGYSGGGPDPDETWVDDVSLQVGATAVEPASWGSIKSLYAE